MELSGCRFFFMPGVPAEMEHIFETEITPLLPAPARNTLCRRLRTFGLAEVEVNDLLVGIEEAHAIVLGYRASHSEIEVKVLADSAREMPPTDLAARLETAVREVHRRLGSAIYAEGTTTLSEAVGALLREKNLTLGLAESCTGGLVSQLLTAVPGASTYYRGGLVSYDNSVKESLLGVGSGALETHGAVSEVVAEQMAEGARRTLSVDIALALTGLAGPGGGTPNKPVGLVHFAVATSSGIHTYHQVFRGTRSQIQRRAALFGLWQVRAALLTEAAP
jgi:nicotinamide-nucleotide amidase